MILAKARLRGGGAGKVRIGLSFPTGFDPEDVLGDSVRANDHLPAEAVHPDPRRGSVHDIYRECEVLFHEEALCHAAGGGTVRITGLLRRGLPFVASLPLAKRQGGCDH